MRPMIGTWNVKLAIGVAAGIVLPGAAAAGKPLADCTLKGFPLNGDVQVVESFPDLKVQVVTSFPDLRVKTVSSFPDKCGEWRFVDSFPDFKIQFVESFPDLKIEVVENFPGLP